MGTLKPGANYIYERADGVTYAREMGADPNTRTAIGWDYGKEPNEVSTLFGMPLKKIAEMVDMIRASETNPALQKALEQCRILYHLSSTTSTSSITHHPV